MYKNSIQNNTKILSALVRCLIYRMFSMCEAYYMGIKVYVVDAETHFDDEKIMRS